MDESFDIFISYKSQDIGMVRPVAEALISQGIAVWFAEYSVLLYDYDQHRTVLDPGLANSRFGVFFTSDDWAGSEHCIDEYDKLAAHLPQSHLLEIGRSRFLKPHQKRPTLANSPYMECDEDVSITLAFIAKQTGLPIDPNNVSLASAQSTAAKWIDRTQHTMFRFNVGPFESKPHMLQGQADNSALFNGVIEGMPVQMMVMSSSKKTALGKLAATTDIVDKDKELVETYHNYARQDFIGKNPYIDRGLHVFFFEGRGQIALTYSCPDGDKIKWERRYVITVERSGAKPSATAGYAELLSNTSKRVMGEVDIVFGVDMPYHDVQKSLRRFCRLTPTFDAIVASMQCQPITLMGEPIEDNWQRISLRHRLLPFKLALPGDMKVEEISDQAIKVTPKDRDWPIKISVEPATSKEVMLPEKWTQVGSHSMRGESDMVIAHSDFSALNKWVRSLFPSGKVVGILLLILSAAVATAWFAFEKTPALIFTASVIGFLVLLMCSAGSQKLRYIFIRDGKQYTLEAAMHMDHTIEKMVQPLVKADN